jgi:hypothetical protein
VPQEIIADFSKGIHHMGLGAPPGTLEKMVGFKPSGTTAEALRCNVFEGPVYIPSGDLVEGNPQDQHVQGIWPILQSIGEGFLVADERLIFWRFRKQTSQGTFWCQVPVWIARGPVAVAQQDAVYFSGARTAVVQPPDARSGILDLPAPPPPSQPPAHEGEYNTGSMDTVFNKHLITRAALWASKRPCRWFYPAQDTARVMLYEGQTQEGYWVMTCYTQEFQTTEPPPVMPGDWLFAFNYSFSPALNAFDWYYPVRVIWVEKPQTTTATQIRVAIEPFDPFTSGKEYLEFRYVVSRVDPVGIAPPENAPSISLHASAQQTGLVEGKYQYMLTMWASKTQTRSVPSPMNIEFEVTEQQSKAHLKVTPIWQSEYNWELPRFVDTVEVWRSRYNTNTSSWEPFWKIGSISLYKRLPQQYTDKYSQQQTVTEAHIRNMQQDFVDDGKPNGRLLPGDVYHHDPPPPLESIRIFNSRMYGILGGAGNQLAFSNLNKFDYWPGTAIDVSPDDPYIFTMGGRVAIPSTEAITAYCPEGGSFRTTGVRGDALILFTHTKAWRWVGWDWRDFQLIEAFDTGCDCPRTLVNLDGVILWMKAGKIYACQSGAPIPQEAFTQLWPDGFPFYQGLTERASTHAVGWRGKYVVHQVGKQGQDTVSRTFVLDMTSGVAYQALPDNTDVRVLATGIDYLNSTDLVAGGEMRNDLEGYPANIQFPVRKGVFRLFRGSFNTDIELVSNPIPLIQERIDGVRYKSLRHLYILCYNNLNYPQGNVSGGPWAGSFKIGVRGLAGESPQWYEQDVYPLKGYSVVRLSIPQEVWPGSPNVEVSPARGWLMQFRIRGRLMSLPADRMNPPPGPLAAEPPDAAFRVIYAMADYAPLSEDTRIPVQPPVI